MRDIIGIPEERLISHCDAIKHVLDDNEKTILLFMDDIIGSGQQFETTLDRQYEINTSGITMSLSDVLNLPSDTEVYYCNVVCTKGGLEHIQKCCSSVNISSAHILGEEYSALTGSSIIWEQGYHQAGVEFIKKYRNLYGYTQEDGSEEDWRGFHKLGLSIAFEHSIPDSTMPIYRSTRNNWKPLIYYHD